MTYLLSSYHPGAVAASLLIATLASHVALDFARRVRNKASRVALGWWAGGSVVMGTGIWCMHFVGMLAFSLPIHLGFARIPTIASWLAAVAASAVALLIASGGSLNWRRLGGGALAMGAGICAMHYTGMASLEVSPGIVWDVPLVAMSGVIAAAASAAALLIFFWLRGISSQRSRLYQIGAASIMGLAICGMHYTGMAAASFPEGSICLAADEIKGDGLGILISIAALGLVVLTLLTSSLDARMRPEAANP